MRERKREKEKEREREMGGVYKERVGVAVGKRKEILI